MLAGRTMNGDRYMRIWSKTKPFFHCSIISFKCSLSCNGGIQRRNALCMSDSNGVKINEKYCLHMGKEILERTCNNEDCPTWSYTADAPVLKIRSEWISILVWSFSILQLPQAVVPVLNAGEILPTTLNNNVYDEVYPTSPSPYPIDRRSEGRKIANHIPMQSTR